MSPSQPALPASPDTSAETNQPDPNHELNYQQTILCAALIGIVGGLVATAYYYVLEASLHFVWHTLPEQGIPYFPGWLPSWNYVLLATTISGLCVGLTLYFMGLPGEVAMVVDKVHDPGRIEVRQTPAMIVASLFSITAGGSAGSEAPLVQVISSFGGWMGSKLRLTLVTTRVLKLLLMIVLAKMLAVCCTLHTGLRGGFIFPLFYIGAAAGYALTLTFPQIHPTIAMVCLMAAVNVAITKTPISTTVILSVLSDTAMVPVIVIACFTSFLLTTNLSLIRTQRSRTPLPPELVSPELNPETEPVNVGVA